jgi:hypothetical protein
MFVKTCNCLYTEQSKINPSVLAFEQELENILLKFAKRNSSGDGYQVKDDIGKRLIDNIRHTLCIMTSQAVMFSRGNTGECCPPLFLPGNGVPLPKSNMGECRSP